MTTLDTLPVENILQIINQFRINEIHSFQMVNRNLNSLIKANESSVYRMAAIVHGYIPPTTSTQSHFRHSFSTVRETVRWKQRNTERGHQVIPLNPDMTWLELCKACYARDKAWDSTSPPRQTEECTLAAPLLLFADGDTFITHGHPGDHFQIFKPRRESSQKSEEEDVVTITPEGRPLTFSEGFFLRTHQSRRFEVWWREPNEVENATSIKNYEQRLRKIGTIQLPNGVTAMRTVGEWTMAIINGIMLYAYHHPAPLSTPPVTPSVTSTNTNTDATTNTAISTGEILPAYQADLAFGIPPNYMNVLVQTSWLTFNDRYIFHLTNIGLRIQARPTIEDISLSRAASVESMTLKEVLFIHEIPWKRIAPAKWTKSITTNVFHVTSTPPSSSSSLLRDIERRGQGDKSDENGVKKETIERGTSSRESRWNWNLGDLVVVDGMIIMTNGRWIVGIPDYEAIIHGQSLEEESWALDLGEKHCYGLFFDGRRLICKLYQKFLVINLHNMAGRKLYGGAEITELRQHDWIIRSASRNDTVLDDTSLWFIGTDSNNDDATYKLIRWEFAE